MGIQGLLKGLQCFTEQRNIRDFENQSLAVDASSWLHKSVYSISERYVEAVEASSRADSLCVQTSKKYLVNRCTELLQHANIRQIYLVLDGDRCPLKAQTNADREERRRTNLAKARKYKSQRQYDKAQEKYKACIKIHGNFAEAVAQAVAQQFSGNDRVHVIYSPYEADAQLVKLCVDGMSEGVVTEVKVGCSGIDLSRTPKSHSPLFACYRILMSWSIPLLVMSLFRFFTN